MLIPVVQAPGQLSPHLPRGDECCGEDLIKSQRRRAVSLHVSMSTRVVTSSEAELPVWASPPQASRWTSRG